MTVDILGGSLRIDWKEDGHVFMTGPATTVFEGEYDASACPADEPAHVIDPDW